MDIEDLIEGQEFWGVLGELVIDPDTNRRRVRTLSGQVVPAGLFIECSKTIRARRPLRTIFKVNVGVSRKPVGRLYLHSLRKGQLLIVAEWDALYGSPSVRA
mgnify:CR=1 FL=1